MTITADILTLLAETNRPLSIDAIASQYRQRFTGRISKQQASGACSSLVRSGKLTREAAGAYRWQPSNGSPIDVRHHLTAEPEATVRAAAPAVAPVEGPPSLSAAVLALFEGATPLDTSQVIDACQSRFDLTLTRQQVANVCSDAVLEGRLERAKLGVYRLPQAAVADVDSLQTRIVQLLTERTRPLSVAAIRPALKTRFGVTVTDRQVTKAIGRLYPTGQLVRVARGTYTVTKEYAPRGTAPVRAAVPQVPPAKPSTPRTASPVTAAAPPLPIRVTSVVPVPGSVLVAAETAIVPEGVPRDVYGLWLTGQAGLAAGCVVDSVSWFEDRQLLASAVIADTHDLLLVAATTDTAVRLATILDALGKDGLLMDPSGSAEPRRGLSTVLRLHAPQRVILTAPTPKVTVPLLAAVPSPVRIPLPLLDGLTVRTGRPVRPWPARANVNAWDDRARSFGAWYAKTWWSVTNDAEHDQLFTDSVAGRLPAEMCTDLRDAAVNDGCTDPNISGSLVEVGFWAEVHQLRAAA